MWQKMYKKIRVDRHKLIINTSEDKVFPYFSIANRFMMSRTRIIRLSSSNDSDMDVIIRFLNYLYEEHGLYFEDDYENVTVELAQRFITNYMFTLSEEGDYPSNNARKFVRSKITMFLMNMKESRLCSQLNENYLCRVNPVSKRNEYELSIFLNDSKVSNPVMRYCPDFFVDECIKQARLHDMDTFITIVLQVDAGLRPSEACNVRCLESSYGPGYAIRSDPTGIINSEMTIDLSKEAICRPLRSDHVSVGSIKKPRTVRVLTENIDHLTDAIYEYQKYTADRKREDYGPLIVSRYVKNGYNMAQTYDGYRKTFKRLVEKYVIPSLIECGGVKREFAYRLQESKYGPHFFREYFTCKMVENGYNWRDIMEARGDKSPDSAIIYLIKGKGFRNQIDKTNRELAELIKNYNKEEDDEKDQMLPVRL